MNNVIELCARVLDLQSRLAWAKKTYKHFYETMSENEKMKWDKTIELYQEELNKLVK